MADLRIQLFGGLYISDDSQSVTAIHQPRLQSLLAYLLLHPLTPHSRRHLAFRFWPDSAEAQARTNLRKALYTIRRRLPESDHFLHSDATMVQWTPSTAFTLDVADFERALSQADITRQNEQQAEAMTHLEAAVTLYRGDLLPDCYDSWILAERERLHQCILTTLEQLMQWLEQARDYASAIRYGRRLLALDPGHEATYRRLMRLHALHGDRASALRVYHTCVDVLQRELGVTPNADTQAVYAHLLRAEPSTMPATQPGQRVDVIHLVGRRREWQQLQAEWRIATKMQPRLALVAGEAGIGKTFLVAQMRSWAEQQGITTAHARTYSAEGGLAYSPVIEWLRSEPFQANLDRLDRIWLSELARLLPELLAADPSLPRPGPLTERWQRQRLFEAMVRAILLAKSPLLLVLDDLQWCDGETLEWLHFLLRSAQDLAKQTNTVAHLLVVGTVRPEEVDEQHPMTRMALGLRNAEQMTEFELGPLSEGETAALATQVAERQLDSGTLQRLYEASEGNPLFVVEMVRSGDWSVRRADRQASTQMQTPDARSRSLPPKAHAVIQSRLAQLSPAARKLASLAATIGRSFTFDLLIHAGDDDEDSLVQGLDELWQRRIVREQGVDAYDFSHDRIRDVAYAETSPIVRKFYHRRVVQALAILQADNLEAVNGQLGLHSERAQQPEEAVGYYRRAVETSVALFAFDSALFFLERILALLTDLPSTVERTRRQAESLLQKADILIITNGWTDVERKHTLERAYRLAQEADNQVLLFDVLDHLVGYYGNTGEQYTKFKLAQDALALAEQIQDQTRLCMAYCTMAGGHLQVGEYGSSLNYFVKAQALAEVIGPDYWQVNSRSRMVETLWASGYPDQARKLATDNLRTVDKLAVPFRRVHEREFAMYVYQRIGDRIMTMTLADEIIALSDRYGFPNYALSNRLIAGWVAIQAGAKEEGLQQISQSLAAMDAIGDYFHRPYFLSLLAEAQAANDRLADALETLRQAQAFAYQFGDRAWEVEVLRLTGDFRYRLDATDTLVESCYQAALSVARQKGARMLELRSGASLARLWHGQGKTVAAHDLLAPICAWFSEGFDTPDLRAAEALLNELDRQRLI